MNRARWLPVLLLLSGCTTWGGTLKVEGIPAAPPPEKAFQVWRGGAVHELHAVRVEPDTLRGVPTSEDRECASCAIAIAKADVDSVRFREFDGGNTTLTVVGVTLLLLGTEMINPILEWFFGG
ncbi:MAG: hypothetical protein M3N43_04815 [Actinomycetota bacterium]|nr:hypothetical protein [Actinomycetota bacterium]